MYVCTTPERFSRGVYMWVYSCLYIHLTVYVFNFNYKYVCVNVYMWLCMCLCKYMAVCAFVYTFDRVCLCIFMWLWLCVYTCVRNSHILIKGLSPFPTICELSWIASSLMGLKISLVSGTKCWNKKLPKCFQKLALK